MSAWVRAEAWSTAAALSICITWAGPLSLPPSAACLHICSLEEDAFWDAALGAALAQAGQVRAVHPGLDLLLGFCTACSAATQPVQGPKCSASTGERD